MTPDPEFAVRGWTPDARDPDPDLGPDTDLGPGPAPDHVGDQPEEHHDEVRHRRPSWWRRIGRGGRFVETWVPESLRDARVDPGRRGALVLSLIAALAAVAAAVGVWRDRPEPRPVQTITHSAGITAGSGTTLDAVAAGSRSVNGGRPASTGTRSAGPSKADHRAPAVLAVSVTGAVRRPGLVRVPAGSRVADAIAAAGGATTAADITGLNVATVLNDGDSVVVGTAGAPSRSAGSGGAGPSDSRSGRASGAPTAGAAGSPVDLNSADSAALEELPGVGPVMAGNIIAWRDANGPFTAVEQLQEIPGIGPARFAQLVPLVTVG